MKPVSLMLENALNLCTLIFREHIECLLMESIDTFLQLLMIIQVLPRCIRYNISLKLFLFCKKFGIMCIHFGGTSRFLGQIMLWNLIQEHVTISFLLMQLCINHRVYTNHNRMIEWRESTNTFLKYQGH